jgi:hypothetical protein
MRKTWKKWAITFLTGATLLQTPSCVETSTVITAIATTVSAGGVLYIVGRIID